MNMFQKAEYRRDLIASQSARCICGYVYAGASVYESTTDLRCSAAQRLLPKMEQFLQRVNASVEIMLLPLPILMLKG